MIHPPVYPPVYQPPGSPKDLPRKEKQEFLNQSVDKLSQAMEWMGIFAIISATFSMLFLVNAEEKQTKEVGEVFGKCYIITEIVLIVAVVAFIAIKIFMKFRS